MNLVADAVSTSVDIHRQWARIVNEILACRLSDFSECNTITDQSENSFFTVIEQLRDIPMLEEKLDALEKLKVKTHQLADMLIKSMQESGEVCLHSYRDFSHSHAQFLRFARDLERHLWMEYANVDQLTGVLNRKVMDTLLDSELRKIQATGEPCILVMADIDHFKKVNDTYGHSVGDEVLRTIATILKHAIRKTDMLFRYGGEEFLICMPGFTVQEGIHHIDKIRQKIALNMFTIENKASFSVTTSFGIALMSNNTQVTDTISQADEALYRAKANGRNRIEGY